MKYTGDTLLNTSLTVLRYKPLDDRTVVSELNDLYGITYYYEGMIVSCLFDNGLYMLIDKNKRTQSEGWLKIGSNGTIDLSTVSNIVNQILNNKNYIETSETEGLIKNDGTIDTNQYITLSDLNEALSNQSSQIKHVILTQSDYDALEIKDNNTIYIIVGTSNTEESWVFGDNFPIVFS